MNLKDFIQDSRLSQREVAAVLGCNPSHISLMCSGKRSLTGLHIRLLIEKYGFDVIAKYCDPSEMPSNYVSVSAPVISGNSAPVQSGNGNQMESPADASLVAVLKQQSDQITTLLAQQERLISLLEKK